LSEGFFVPGNGQCVAGPSTLFPSGWTMQSPLNAFD
jgi:hypothetical protein